jgi:hypothetical protein
MATALDMCETREDFRRVEEAFHWLLIRGTDLGEKGLREGRTLMWDEVLLPYVRLFG